MPDHVLRLRRTDSQDNYILLHISRQTDRQDSLDLKLIGTEHEQLFHASLKDSNVNNLQSSNFTGDLNEWKTLLRYVLLHERPKNGKTEILEGVETVAAISGKRLTVTIRKNIGGITQRLGSIRLDEDTGKEEVSGFEWAETAAADADSLRLELETLQASVSSQKDDVAKLNQQLDDLVKAKKEHEDELLRKFAALLNSKKLKIRDQQRLLNGAQIDPQAARAVRDSREGTGRSPGSSRRGKRTANDASNEPQGGDEEESEGGGNEAAEPAEETPPPSDQETEDESFDEAPAPSAATQRTAPAVRQNETSSMDVDDPDELPPRRELPFSRSTRQTSRQPEPKRPTPANQAEDDDDDDTEEEL